MQLVAAAFFMLAAIGFTRRGERTGVASAWMLREMAMRAMAPKAILFDRANTILAQGAAFAEMTLVDRFEAGCPTTLIRTGDEIAIEPADGRVTILNRD